MSDLSELRQAVIDLRERQAAMEKTVARTDANVIWIREAMDYQVRRGDDHAKRLKRLWWIAAIFTAIGVLLGIGGYIGLRH